MLILWVVGLLAFVAAVAGITVAIRVNQAVIVTWLTDHNRELAYGVGLIGGLGLLGLLAYFHPFVVLLIALTIVVIAAVVMNWTDVGPFLKTYWFQTLASFVIVGSGLWLIAMLGALPSQILLFWSVVAMIVVAMIVFWSAMWQLVGKSWQSILVVATILILIVAFTRATTSIRSTVTGWWSQITQAGSVGGDNSSPSFHLPGATPTLKVKTEAEVANCFRQLANTPPYLDPESERAKVACQ